MKKKKKSPVLIITIILFGVYLALYYLSEHGYYDIQERNKMLLTEEAMKQFEEDVSKGLDVSINDYLPETSIEYRNNVSKLGYKSGKAIEEFVTKGIVLGSLVSD